MWMWMVLYYGLAKGARDVVKKLALNKNTIMEVLVFYTFLTFLMTLSEIPEAGGMESRFYFYIAIKSFLIFIAWICSFKAIKKLPISIYGILDLSRVLFATLLGVIVLKETLDVSQISGLVLVSLGLIMLKFSPSSKKKTIEEKEQVSILYVIAAFASCILNATSGLMDKILMRDLNSSQLQFWYMLFLLIYYILYVIITRTKLSFSVLKNGWIWVLAILFFTADKALFIANSYEESRITIMTLIKQSGCLISILAGKFIFKEKNVGYKLICASVIVIGILAAVLL